ncbi:hypothetical protein [Vreelandella utahensis]|uniref:hypothetical protein n=1 Tax=Vreelandella halophila TaxID=86177 RepID=UPI000987153A|nr:hypothetical protein [Halomonas utahensis]
MMLRPLNTFCAALVLLLAAFPAMAQPLSDERIEGFLASLEDLESLGERIENTDLFGDMGREIQEQATRKGEFRPMRMMVDRMRDHEMHNEFAAVVSDHGFQHPEDWADTGDRIMRAMAAMELKKHNRDDMRKEMSAMMKQMEDNPNISEQQRKRMRQQMEQAMAGMKAMADAPQADIEAVRPYRDRIRQAMDN